MFDIGMTSTRVCARDIREWIVIGFKPEFGCVLVRFEPPVSRIAEPEEIAFGFFVCRCLPPELMLNWKMTVHRAFVGRLPELSVANRVRRKEQPP